jgi:stress response protein YsnF|tara:strand:+ start:270 stop:524 length:255 start_codon:yes stop_codon:yes gene_type:complete
MNEKKVLSQEEIDELKELQNTFKNLTEVSGVIEMQHYNIQLKKEQLKSNLQSLQEKEVILAKNLEDKYGQGSISLETGEFLPSK